MAALPTLQPFLGDPTCLPLSWIRRPCPTTTSSSDWATATSRQLTGVMATTPAYASRPVARSGGTHGASERFGAACAARVRSGRGLEGWPFADCAFGGAAAMGISLCAADAAVTGMCRSRPASLVLKMEVRASCNRKRTRHKAGESILTNIGYTIPFPDLGGTGERADDRSAALRRLAKSLPGLEAPGLQQPECGETSVTGAGGLPDDFKRPERPSLQPDHGVCRKPTPACSGRWIESSRRRA